MLLLYFAIIYEKDVNSNKLHNGAKLFEKSHLNLYAPWCSTSVLVFGCWHMNLKLRQKYLLLKAVQIHKLLTIFTQNDDFFKPAILTEKKN